VESQRKKEGKGRTTEATPTKNKEDDGVGWFTRQWMPGQQVKVKGFDLTPSCFLFLFLFFSIFSEENRQWRRGSFRQLAMEM